MEILVPIDGSEPSEHALEVAIDLVTGLDATLHVLHVTDHETDATEQIVSRAEKRLAEAGVDGEVEIYIDESADAVGASRSVGQDILDLVETRGYDHVVMGTHGGGRIEEMFVGSASKTVLSKADVPVTVVP